MAQIFYEDKFGNQNQMSVDELSTLFAGSAIQRIVQSGDEMEIVFGDVFKIRIHGPVLLVPREYKFPPIKCRLVGQGPATADSIERALRSLRQLYAIAFLIENDRFRGPVSGLDQGLDLDYEKWLEPDDLLFIESVSSGSLWITALAKTKAAFNTLRVVAGLLSDRGREAILRRLEADAILKELEVRRGELDLELARANGFIDLVQKIEKIKDVELRARAREALFTHINALSQALPPSLSHE